MPLGTTVDPNFYQEKAARAGQLIQLLLQNQQRKAAQQDAREKEQLNFFFNAAQSDPSLANSMGPDLVEKYGDKYPILPALVNSLQERQKIVGNMDTASKAFTDKLTSMQNNYQQMQEHAASLPDTLPFHVQVPTLQGQVSTNSPSPWLNQQARDSNASFADTASSLSPGITLPIPNPEKARVQATLSQMDPMMFPVSAAISLPADQQALVHMNPALAHLLPKQMPSLEDIPIEERPLVLGRMGLVTPESVEAAKMKIGAIPKPATLQEQQAALDLQNNKLSGEWENAQDQRDWADTHQGQQFENEKTLEQLKDAHSKQRIAQNLSGESALEDKKIQGQKDVLSLKQGYAQNDDGTIPWKSISDTSNSQLKDWQDAYKRQVERQAKLKTGSGDPEADLNSWLKKNPRPVRVPENVARMIALKTNRIVKQNPDAAGDAAIVAQKKASEYQQLMLQPGMTSDRAMSALFPP